MKKISSNKKKCKTRKRINPSKIILSRLGAIKKFFTSSLNIEDLAHSCLFIQRSSAKINAASFLFVLSIAVLGQNPTLLQLCQLLKDFFSIQISTQSLFEKINNPYAALFLKKILHAFINSKEIYYKR